jgi:serine/threonine protein kinase
MRVPTVLRPGLKVKGYSVVRVLNKGAFAVAYEARTSAGEKVFFKQYKSPSVTVDWYSPYVAYQQELKRRVEGSTARAYCYRFIEFFESNDSGQRCFYQVFEFVDKGKDLRKYLEELAGKPPAATWPQRLTFAKLFMAGMKALHEARIIHCDLKPDNLYLIPDATIKAGYQLKIVDMDFSVLSDRRAPWHGEQGYVGTPGYQSPEHLAGQIPVPASDVFTCGLILYELLAQGHPYPMEDDEARAQAVRG